MDHRIEQAAKEIVDEFGICYPDSKVKSVAAILSRHLSSNEWVACSERLPEQNPNEKRKWYLVSDGERMDFAMLLKDSFMGHVLQFGAVKYWQEPPPLPAPPSATTQLGEEK